MRSKLLFSIAAFFAAISTSGQECADIEKVNWWGLDSIRTIPSECDGIQEKVASCAKEKSDAAGQISEECAEVFELNKYCVGYNRPKYYSSDDPGVGIVCDSVIRSWNRFQVPNIVFRVKFAIESMVPFNADTILAWMQEHEEELLPVFQSVDVYNGFYSHCMQDIYEMGQCFILPTPNLQKVNFEDLVQDKSFVVGQGHLEFSARKEDFLEVIEAFSKLDRVDSIKVEEVIIDWNVSGIRAKPWEPSLPNRLHGYDIRGRRIHGLNPNYIFRIRLTPDN